MEPGDPAAAVRVTGIRHRFGRVAALTDVSLVVRRGEMTGLIGPDGAGKSTLLALVAGTKIIQQGSIEVLGGDLADKHHRDAVCPRIAYLPQGLGRNLYATLTVEENLQFFARLFGHGAEERRRRIDAITAVTGLREFLDRPVGKLSGGMRQKLGLCCALIHDPDLLILDEPTTGVDPLARARFWELIGRIRAARPGMSVLVATGYMDEARRFDRLVALDAGRVLADATPDELLRRTGCATMETAFVALLPGARPAEARGDAAARTTDGPEDIAIEAHGLTLRFGDFTAVDQVDFRIRRGEIFGFLGSNGCGKTTTMKMLTGLLPASAGTARLFGRPVDGRDLETRRRIGYMSQTFSLYGELTVRQNLVLHAQLFQVPPDEVEARVAETAGRFGLDEHLGTRPGDLPIGIRQRLSLAVAMVHRPELLILDEPTSGVDPVTRDRFWDLMTDLVRRDRVTIFVSTHLMSEAERCDRVSLMHAGRVLDSGTPAELMARHGAKTLEGAFIDCLGRHAAAEPAAAELLTPTAATPDPHPPGRLGRLLSHAARETLELRRDPVRGALALVGSLVLLVVMAFGISMDVEHLRFAVLDRDQTSVSRGYATDLAGSRYLSEQPPLADYAELDRRMRSGEVSVAIEIPAGFARDLARGQPVRVGAWVDGAMPTRAETALGYLQGMHAHWMAGRRPGGAEGKPAYALETRFRYNPDVRSLPAMVPAVIPLLLLMLPAMLTALAVVREKELGTIVNLYVTPTTPAEFMLGKQLPYVALALFNFGLMTLLAVTLFGVPVTGSFPTLLLATGLFALCSTGMGLLASALTRSQLAAMFFALIGTMLPAYQYAGLINPVTSLQGVGRLIGEAYPASHMLIVSRGVFNKALGFADLRGSLWPLAVAAPLIIGLAIALLRKQEK